jgi:hypothetical protein
VYEDGEGVQNDCLRLRESRDVICWKRKSHI